MFRYPRAGLEVHELVGTDGTAGHKDPIPHLLKPPAQLQHRRL